MDSSASFVQSMAVTTMEANKVTKDEANTRKKAVACTPGSYRFQNPEEAIRMGMGMHRSQRQGPIYETPLNFFKDQSFEDNGREVEVEPTSENHPKPIEKPIVKKLDDQQQIFMNYLAEMHKRSVSPIYPRDVSNNLPELTHPAPEQ